jgi:hypothetical protein
MGFRITALLTPVPVVLARRCRRLSTTLFSRVPPVPSPRIQNRVVSDCEKCKEDVPGAGSLLVLSETVKPSLSAGCVNTTRETRLSMFVPK